jgi:hypothetical protein
MVALQVELGLTDKEVNLDLSLHKLFLKKRKSTNDFFDVNFIMINKHEINFVYFTWSHIAIKLKLKYFEGKF